MEFDAQYPEKLHDFHSNLRFLSERINFVKVGKLVANLHDEKRICNTHKKSKTCNKPWINTPKKKKSFLLGIYLVNVIKSAIAVVLRKVHTVIKFSQEAWLKP